MQKLTWLPPAIAGCLVAVLVASQLAGWVQMDACLDAGGQFDRITGACDAAPNTRYVTPFARPTGLLFWGGFLGVSLALDC